MELENQICSKELSQQLERFGIKKESYFEWLFYPDKMEWRASPAFENKLGYSAYTVAELGEILPNYIQVKGFEPFDNYRIVITKFYSVNEDRSLTNNYIINYECDSTNLTGEAAWLRRRLINNIYDPNLANAMAKMLIYLIENNLLRDNLTNLNCPPNAFDLVMGKKE